MCQKTILLAGGGTGGHLFPAIALAEEFKQYSALAIHLVTDQRGQKYLGDVSACHIHIIDLYLRNQNIISRVKGIIAILRATWQAWSLMRKLQPAIIIGFGGYPSFPTLVAGYLLGIPIIIYEPNSVLGKVNKLFASSAQLIALACLETNIHKKYRHKTVVTGSLIRNVIKQVSVKGNLLTDPFTILVIGGSQGANIFSTLVPQAIELLLNHINPAQIRIIQQAGHQQQVNLATKYSTLKIEHVLAEFFPDIANYYQQANIMISRAGASTIAEITNIGLPAILIPLPSAADNHQYYNAKSLSQHQAGWCFAQDTITPTILADQLLELINDRNQLVTVSTNLLKMSNLNSDRHLSATVLKIIESIE